MKTIIAVTDFSRRSAVAVQRATALAVGAGANLVLVHAVDDSLPEHILAHRVAEAEVALREEAVAITGAQVSWQVAVGDVFWVLHRAATQAHADLIVAGDHRRSAVRDLFRDTTVERLIRVSALPVLIARGPAEPSYRHALVCVENDEGGELIEVLGRLGKAAPARATVLHAVSVPAEGLLYYANVERDVREDYSADIKRKARSRLAASLPNAAFPVTIRIIDMEPLPAITKVVESAGCNLVAVSSHARRSIARGLLGSVSSDLIRHGTTDLLIVPRIT